MEDYSLYAFIHNTHGPGRHTLGRALSIDAWLYYQTYGQANATPRPAAVFLDTMTREELAEMGPTT